MVNSVTFSTTAGGDGSTVTDDNNTSTGLGNGGHRTRFVPCLSQTVAVAATAVAAAANAVNAPGTQATSATSFTLTLGSKTFTLVESGKTFPLGAAVSIARTSDPTKVCYGNVTSFSGTTLIVNVTRLDVSGGPYTDWTIALSGAPGANAPVTTAGTQITSNTTLTSSSAGYQPINVADYGAAITLPNATTLGLGGPRFVFDNSQSAFPVRILNNSNTLLGFIPPRTVSNCYVRSNLTSDGEFGITNLELAGISSIFNTAYLDVIIAEIDLGSNRDLILGYDTATGYSYAVCRNNLTNAYGSVVAVRSANVTTKQAAISCGTDKVLVVSCDATTGFEAVVLSISTLTITVNTAATATLSANISSFADGCGIIAAGSSWVTSYTVATPAAQIRAISVSGTTPTIGSATELDGTAGGLIVASSSVVIAVSTATTNLYTKPYTISGSTITPGTGTTTTSGTMTLNKLSSIDTYWCIIYNDGGSTVKGGIITLSGTTTTLSTATLFSAGVLEDAFVLSTTKVLVTNNQTSSNINILTNTTGTASAGTATTCAVTDVNNILCLSSATNIVFTQSSITNNYIVTRIAYGSASPVISRQMLIANTNTTTAQLPDYGKSNSMMQRSATGLYSTNFARTINQTVATQGFCGFVYKDTFTKKEGVTLNGISLGHYRGKNDRVRYITDQSSAVYVAECVA